MLFELMFNIYVLRIISKALVTKGKIELKGMEKALSILKGVLDYSDFKDVDIWS